MEGKLKTIPLAIIKTDFYYFGSGGVTNSCVANIIYNL